MGGEGRIYKHICLNIVGGEHIWPAPLGNLCSIFFFSGVGMSWNFSGMGGWKNIQNILLFIYGRPQPRPNK